MSKKFTATMTTIRENLNARATSVEEAAQHVARRLHGRKAFAMRQTGAVGMSGMFQCYVPAQPYRGCSYAVGGYIHLQEA